jgi:hypothetical protein
MLKNHRNSDICKYKKQRNSVNNLKKIAKENFETNLDNFFLKMHQIIKLIGKL